jgi:hypothetical protein
VYFIEAFGIYIYGAYFNVEKKDPTSYFRNGMYRKLE